MKRILTIFLLCTASVRASAESAGATGAAFLKLGVGARAVAMGEAYAAEANSVESLYWNPAGLVNTWRPALLVSYKPIVEDTAQSQAAVAVRYKNMGFGAGYNGVAYKKIDAYDANMNAVGNYEAADHEGVAGAAIGWEKVFEDGQLTASSIRFLQTRNGRKKQAMENIQRIAQKAIGSQPAAATLESTSNLWLELQDERKLQSVY